MASIKPVPFEQGAVELDDESRRKLEALGFGPMDDALRKQAPTLRCFYSTECDGDTMASVCTKRVRGRFRQTIQKGRDSI